MCRQETHMKCRLKPQGNSSMRKPNCWWQDIKNILPRSEVDYLVQDSDVWETFCEQVQWTLRVYWPAEQLSTAQETSASWLATQKWLYANHKGLLLNMDRSISQKVLQMWESRTTCRTEVSRHRQLDVLAGQVNSDVIGNSSSGCLLSLPAAQVRNKPNKVAAVPGTTDSNLTQDPDLNGRYHHRKSTEASYTYI
jgi:hypothetical protein